MTLCVGVDVVFGQSNGLAAAAWTRRVVEQHPQLPALCRVVKALLRQGGGAYSCPAVHVLAQPLPFCHY